MRELLRGATRSTVEEEQRSMHAVHAGNGSIKHALLEEVQSSMHGAARSSHEHKTPARGMQPQQHWQHTTAACSSSSIQQGWKAAACSSHLSGYYDLMEQARALAAIESRSGTARNAARVTPLRLDSDLGRLASLDVLRVGSGGFANHTYN